jgi:hypothetical protein
MNAIKLEIETVEGEQPGTITLEIEALEERIAPSNANFPPGQFPAGNPAHAPGNSNPNSH